MNEYEQMTDEEYRKGLADIFSTASNKELQYFYIIVCKRLNILPEGGEEE